MNKNNPTHCQIVPGHHRHSFIRDVAADEHVRRAAVTLLLAWFVAAARHSFVRRQQ